MKADPAVILGAAAASHVPVLVDVLDNIGEHDYELMSTANYDVLLQRDWREAQRIYWLEILLPGTLRGINEPDKNGALD